MGKPLGRDGGTPRAAAPGVPFRCHVRASPAPIRRPGGTPPAGGVGSRARRPRQPVGRDGGAALGEGAWQRPARDGRGRDIGRLQAGGLMAAAMEVLAEAGIDIRGRGRRVEHRPRAPAVMPARVEGEIRREADPGAATVSVRTSASSGRRSPANPRTPAARLCRTPKVIAALMGDPGPPGTSAAGRPSAAGRRSGRQPQNPVVEIRPRLRPGRRHRRDPPRRTQLAASACRLGLRAHVPGGAAELGAESLGEMRGALEPAAIRHSAMRAKRPSPAARSR